MRRRHPFLVSTFATFKHLFSFLMQVAFDNVKLKLSAKYERKIGFLTTDRFFLGNVLKTQLAETDYLQNSDHSENRSEYPF